MGKWLASGTASPFTHVGHSDSLIPPSPQACFICGESGHRTEHCPKKALEIYQLPSDIKAKADEQYERDVARMGHSTAGMESEYRSFLKVGQGGGDSKGRGSKGGEEGVHYRFFSGEGGKP